MTFASYFSPDNNVVAINNLGNDARLLVPKALINEQYYTHLALFVRNAPENQIIELWKKTGKQMQMLISENKIWLNTAGHAIAWLHIRIDSFPKYYSYKPYKFIM